MVKPLIVKRLEGIGSKIEYLLNINEEDMIDDVNMIQLIIRENTYDEYKKSLFISGKVCLYKKDVFESDTPITFDEILNEKELEMIEYLNDFGKKVLSKLDLDKHKGKITFE